MAYFFPKDDITFVPHPKFDGVKWAPLINAEKTDRISVCLLLLEPDVEIARHIHDPQIDSIFVLEGEGEAFVNGKWEKIKPGDYVFVPARDEHGVKNTGNSPLKLFIVHSPPLY
ncbi:cupin domain-containing protein [Thermodesulfatator atlanticus]|uniref:cupin domain-containing protein n=1 Tax=Thermodesulfatator atlanticus TaxID=501497 RepID=UPI0003B654C1|nr:cupin domain-containing protein [Thermodesulfatator atlanticus]